MLQPLHRNLPVLQNHRRYPETKPLPISCFLRERAMGQLKIARLNSSLPRHWD